MGLRILNIALISLLISSAAAQSDGIELGMAKHFRMIVPGQGFDPGGNGFSIGVKVNFDLSNPFHVKVGAEAGSNGIGNYVGSLAGIYRTVNLPAEKLSLEFGLNTMHGFALFHQGGIYLLGFAEENILYYHLANGKRIGCGIELQFLSSPAYSVYSQVNSFIDLHIGLSYIF